MKRRDALALLGGMTGLAGCSLTQTDDPTATGTPIEPPGADATPTPTPTETPPPDREISVSLDALQPAYVDLNVDYYKLVSAPDTQYLFVDVRVESGIPPAISDFVLRFDGNTYTPMVFEYPADIIRESGSPWDTDERYPHGWLVFELPETGDSSDFTLTWPGQAAGGWRPDRETLNRVAAPLPSLLLDEWHAPAPVPEGSYVTFQFTVTNDHDLPGHFVGGINTPDSILGPHHPVAVGSHEIPPNETTTWEVVGNHAPPISIPDGLDDDVQPTVTYECVWWGGDPSYRTVQIAST